jgi:hypothetical protein
MGMAYNPHLLLDYGAMTLAAAVPLAAAAVRRPSPVLLRSVSGSYALWATAHFQIHLQYRSHSRPTLQLSGVREGTGQPLRTDDGV